MRKIRTAIASYGMSGSVFHAPLLEAHVGFELAGILERNSDRSASTYPGARIFRDYDELLADRSIELVVVNTPDDLHHDMCLEALEAGKHAVVEKPFTLTAARADHLIAVASNKRLMLSVFQNRRWDSDFLTIRKIVSEGLLGRLVSYEARFERFRNYIQKDTWKEKKENGTGTLYNLGSHLIDQALVLFGLPGSVTADVRSQRDDSKVDDAFSLWLEYPGVKVSLHASYLVRQPGPRYQLHGTEGSYLKEGTDPQEEALKDGKIPGSPGWGEEEPDAWGLLDTISKGLHYRGRIGSIPGNYLAYYDDIHRALTRNKIPAVTAEQARDVIRVIEGAYTSSLRKSAVPLWSR